MDTDSHSSITSERVKVTTETAAIGAPGTGKGGSRPDRVAVLSVLSGPQSGKQFRLGEETLIGRGDDVTITLPFGDVSRLHARIVRSATSIFHLEDLRSRNGTRINGEPVESHTLEVGDRVGIGAESVLLFTQRSPEEEELLETQKLESLGRLAGGIAHDFNNLLAVIQGNAQLVQTATTPALDDNPMVGECLSDVISATQRARDLVQQLLGFARRGHWEEVPTDVSALVEEVSQLVVRTFDRNIQLETRIDPALVVIGDRTQLFQMLMNLCLNARDAMAHGGKLLLTASLAREDSEPRLVGRGPQVLFRVQDNGEGMDPQTQRRIFEPFYTTKRAGRGTGLGLAVVYGIVSSHGGKVWVESGQGEGTIFRVALPAADAASLRVDHDHPTIAPNTMSLQKVESGLVLVVDDERLVRRGVARMMKQLGYEVETAGDGVEALMKYQRLGDRVSVVLLDLIMPAMGGEHALREIRKLDPSARVLVMSGYHDETTVDALRNDGAAGFLVKPFSMDQLNAALKVTYTTA